jgi:copper oxidase (laccase) domain-containing protein
MFHLTRKREIEYFQSDIFDDENFSHAFSTRIRGASSDFALMDKSDEKNEQITQNRKDFCEILGINFDNLIIPEQKHTSNIQIVSKGAKFNPQNTDGIIIYEETCLQCCFLQTYTDNFICKRARSLCPLHAGWRGTADCIAKKAVEKMERILELLLKK